MGKSKLKLFGLEILVSFEISTHAHPDSVAHCFWSLCGNSTTDSWGCARHNLVHRATTNCRSLSSSRLVDDLHLNSPRTSIKPLMVTSERLIMDQLRKIACLYVSVVFKNVANVAQACEVFHGFRRIAIPGSVPGGNREAWLLFGMASLWTRPRRLSFARCDLPLPGMGMVRSLKSSNTRATACHVSTCWLQWGWCRTLMGWHESDVRAGSFVVWTPLKESLSRSEYSYVYIRIYRYV